MYAQKLKYAQELGYKDLTEAIGKFGGANSFNQAFKQEKNSVVMHDFNPMYKVFKNGDVYSKYLGNLMVATKYKGKGKYGKPHYAYKLRTLEGYQKCFQKARLVMFYFGNHHYKNIDDMPPICFKTNDTNNCQLHNLKFAEKGEIISKAVKYRSPDCNSIIKDHQIEGVKILINQQFSNAKIGLVYGCSEMAVHRFRKRNKV